MKSTAQNPLARWEALRLRWKELNLWRFATAQLCFLSAPAPVVFAKRLP